MATDKIIPDGYSTHQAMLVKYASMASEGDLLVELGCGFYSTPLLDSIAYSRKLRFKCFYQDQDWQNKISKLCPNTEFIKVNNWKEWKLQEDCFLCLLDNEQLCVDRFKQIDKCLFERSKYIVVHDADIYPKRGINIRDLYQGEYFDKLVPHTFVIDTNLNKKEIPAETNIEIEDVNPVEISIEPQIENPIEPTDANIKTAVVCCFTPGGDYDEHYIEYIKKLSEGVYNNTTKHPDFYCITIMDISEIPNVKRIEPIDKSLKGWHIKAEVFRSELWTEYDRVLYLDLDTVICGNIDEMLKSKTEFALVRDFYRLNDMTTSIIYFNPSITQSLYNKFVSMKPNKNIKDEDITKTWCKRNGISVEKLQDKYDIASYKADLIRDNRNWQDFSIVCFHGIPRPHHVNWSLIIDEKTEINNNIRRNVNKLSFDPVDPIWKGEDVFIIGGGPSLKGIDLDKYLIDKNVIGINDGFLFKCCKICYFGDTIWHKHNKEKLLNFKGLIYTTSTVKDETIRHLDVQGNGISDNPNTLCFNGNSGMAGINLACHLGAKRIFLFGFDMRFSDGNESNWHPNIRTVASNTYKCFLGKQTRLIRELNNKFPDVEVYNVETIKDYSMLTVFQKIQFNDLFTEAQE